jgi:Cu(I)/Ag(I) efflux system membrane fusion protein
MRTLFSFLRRHWRKAATLVLVIACGGAYIVSPLVREKTHVAWHAALAWAGVGGESVDTGKVFWCPMHPQIKSKKENYVCPICSMALVELEGGIVEAPQHLTLTVQQVQQAGVVTAPVMRRKLYREIDTTGRIDYDERRLAKITSWVRGKSRIDKLHVNYKGIHVEQGQPLVELYSPDLIVAQQEYLSALRTLSGRTAGGFESELLKSARQKLKYQGLSDVQIDELTETKQPKDRIAILAPIHGTVHKRNVQEGQYVTEGEVLFELVDLSQLWVFADIFEEEIPLVKLGLPVEVTAQHLPDQVFHGEIAFIDHMVKPGTRTVQIRVDVANTEHTLKAGMFARVRLRHEWPSVLAVSENTVMWSGQRAVVLVKGGEGTFAPREVQLGRKWLYSTDNGATGDRTLGFGEDRVRYHEVLAGLTPGEEVVTAGAFLLNAESQFQNVLAKMLPPKSQRATLEQVVGEPIGSGIRGVLDSYFKLSQSLADDKLDDVSARLAALSKSTKSLAEAASESGDDTLKADTRAFQALVASLSAERPKDAVDARTRFGRISHELTTLLAAHGGKTLFGHELYQFECGMAKVGYERWLWWSPETHNPYMGQKMLKCGTKLDVLEP